MAENENEWKTVNLGQNTTIQEIAAAAATASELLEVNTKLASTTLKAAGAFLLALLNPYIALLNAVADLIDDYVKDFKNIGFYVLEISDGAKLKIPEDAEGNPILLPLSSAAIITHSAIAMSLNMGEEFADWAKYTLGEDNVHLTGPQKGEYRVATGPATKGRRDNSVAEYHSELDLHTMTPSIVIATMISAMDDKADLRRPQFSKNAEAGAIVIIMGIPDMMKGLATIKDTIDAFKFFFGGEEEEEKDEDGKPVYDECGNKKMIPSTGVIAGIGKLDKLITASLAGIQCPALNNVTVKVNNVCGVRGTEDDKKTLNSIGKPANYAKQFETGDYVAGPRVKLGARCMGYVSAVIKDTTVKDEDATDKYGNNPFYSQTLKITGLTNFDRIGWQSLSSGAKLSKVAFKEEFINVLDQNTGISKRTGPFNGYEYISNLSIEEAKKAEVQVEREAGETLLTRSEVDVTEEHERETHHGGIVKFTTLNTVQGDIFEAKLVEAKAPNFKSVKLEDFIEEWATFFSAIDALTDALREMAKDAGKALKRLIKWLDDKIKEIEDINKALQKVLKLFTDGLGDAGVYVLKIPVATGGNDYIKTQLQSAANKPPDTLELSIGFMMVGGGIGSASTGFKTLQKLLVP